MSKQEKREAAHAIAKSRSDAFWKNFPFASEDKARGIYELSLQLFYLENNEYQPSERR